MKMSEYLFGEQRYGIHAIYLLPEDNGIGVCCDCRTLTHLILDTTGEVTDFNHIDLPEQSFTCDGCETTHWFTIKPYEAR